MPQREEKSFYVATLGCKINQYESESIAEAWRAKGLAEAESPAGADVLLVNSCAVTGRAVSDLRALVRRLRQDNPAARLLITGCAAQVLEGELAALPGVDLVLPQARKAELLSGPAPQADGDAAPTTAPAQFPPFAIRQFRRARAVVKVQDGCSHRCTYCIVPLTRGQSVSRAPGDAIEEMRRLLAAGYRELVLSGVNLRQYGRDLAEPLDFWELLARAGEALAPQWAGRARLRLSSLEPGQLNARALEVLGASRLLAPHLHLSLQSGDAEVLKRMGRGHYRPEQVLEFLGQLASHWPRLALGADILTGFPGETDGQFENTYAFVKALPLTYAHVFPYSPRPGTPAASWPDGLQKAERTSRAARLRGLAEAKKRAFRKELSGLARLSVLVERVEGEYGHGTCEFYAPCVVRGPGLRPGMLAAMRPEGLAEGRIVGALLPDTLQDDTLQADALHVDAEPGL